MSRYFCHDHPDVLALETTIVDARPGAVVLRAEYDAHFPTGERQRLAYTQVWP
jgi:hypothetical protein